MQEFAAKTSKFCMNKLLLFLLPFLLLACSLVPTEEPPGVGAKAERGYAACEPIITALEQVRAETGEYPAALEELVPEYLASIPRTVNDQPLEYAKTPAGFSLTFRYLGPGMNWCVYTPADGWDCSGAY